MCRDRYNRIRIESARVKGLNKVQYIYIDSIFIIYIYIDLTLLF